MAFTDYGSENLVELIRIKDNLNSSSGDIGGSIVRPAGEVCASCEIDVSGLGGQYKARA
ncbi:hypothetical protein [Bradyrhizobium yuanmingense]|uniref:hypothetical protein n=1 Tax=Bradyrhizobium yuanmingense TaxID=108015 RepID=UPI0023BA14D2|nr:hypothetical protein [Bradyrhizobium yuanmingense]MDF0498410.1 hypothetical protein [Bradyrhizobium yuanmingense]